MDRPSESDDNETQSLETPLTNIMQEDKIQKILSAEHIEQQLKQHHTKEECKTPDESPYWSWMSSNVYAEAQLEEYLKYINTNNLNTPHEEEIMKEEVYLFDINLDKELIVMRNSMNPTELLQWILDSCQLGLIPSADILRKLLLSNVQKDNIYQPLVDDCKLLALPKSDQKLSLHESEPYRNECPCATDNDLDFYWDERPTKRGDDSIENNYWDERPQEAEGNDVPYLNEDTRSKPKRIIGIFNDNERASVAEYYLTMLNKEVSLSSTPMSNEDDERASLAAFYRSQQVSATAVPIVQKAEEVQNFDAAVDDDAGNENSGYWDEQCSNHDMEEEDDGNYWNF